MIKTIFIPQAQVEFKCIVLKQYDSNNFLCYAQNRLFELKETDILMIGEHLIDAGKQYEFNILVEYCVMPELDKLLNND